MSRPIGADLFSAAKEEMRDGLESTYEAERAANHYSDSGIASPMRLILDLGFLGRR